MARTQNEEEYALRRNEILDAAQMFAYTKGFEQMTIQDILDQLKISKGAFYHYFDSKHALLEGLVDRTIQQAKDMLVPLVDDPDLPALEKLHRFFDSAARWKTTRKEFFIALVRVWYNDDNALLRQKINDAGYEWIIPQLTKIIHQGIREGVFATDYPDQVGDIIMGMLVHMGDNATTLLIAALEGHGDRKKLDDLTAAYTATFEKLLCLPPGTVHIIEPEILDAWFNQPQAPAAQVK